MAHKRESPMGRESSIFKAETIKLINGISSESRRQILSTLSNEGELSFTALLGCLDMSKGNLNHHLHMLESSGLVSNFLTSRNKESYSTYRLTVVGENLLQSLETVFFPKERKVLSEASVVTNSTPSGSMYIFPQVKLEGKLMTCKSEEVYRIIRSLLDTGNVSKNMLIKSYITNDGRLVKPYYRNTSLSEPAGNKMKRLKRKKATRKTVVE